MQASNDRAASAADLKSLRRQPQSRLTDFRSTSRTSALAGIVHVDARANRRARYVLPVGDTLSERVFVPRGDDAAEGDGWLLSVVWRARENRSDLAVFEATEIERGPVALVRLGHRVPDGFHGNWVGAA